MPRTLLAALLAAPLALGCSRGPEPAAAPNSNTSLTPQQAVTRASPVVQRAITQNDLSNLQKYMEFTHAESGKYPKSLAELSSDVKRDLPKLYQAIEEGEIVLVGGQGGVLAYDKALVADRQSVLTTAGIQMMTPDELQQKLNSGG